MQRFQEVNIIMKHVGINIISYMLLISGVETKSNNMTKFGHSSRNDSKYSDKLIESNISGFLIMSESFLIAVSLSNRIELISFLIFSSMLMDGDNDVLVIDVDDNDDVLDDNIERSKVLTDDEDNIDDVGVRYIFCGLSGK